MNIGKIVQVIGPVLDVEFPAENLPAINNAVRVRLPAGRYHDVRRASVYGLLVITLVK